MPHSILRLTDRGMQFNRMLHCHAWKDILAEQQHQLDLLNAQQVETPIHQKTPTTSMRGNSIQGIAELIAVSGWMLNEAQMSLVKEKWEFEMTNSKSPAHAGLKSDSLSVSDANKVASFMAPIEGNSPSVWVCPKGRMMRL